MQRVDGHCIEAGLLQDVVGHFVAVACAWRAGQLAYGATETRRRRGLPGTGNLGKAATGEVVRV